MERWCGKVAVVTGVSSGIGECVARDLVKHGMKVAGLARRIDRVKKLEQDLKGCKGVLHPIQCDITDAKQVESAFQWVEQNWGAVSVLVNNAGYLKTVMLSDANIDEVQKMYNVNVMGLTMCASKAVKSMKKHDVEGCIININSVAGHSVLLYPGIGPYCASKNAVRVLSETLRNEVAIFSRKIRVTNLSPGLVETEMTEPFKPQLTPDTPSLKGQDVSNCVVFVLTSPVHVNLSELTVQPTSESIMTHIVSGMQSQGKKE